MTDSTSEGRRLSDDALFDIIDEIVADPRMDNIHKAAPAGVFADDAESTCIHCHKGIRKVPGGRGPTWVHSDTGAVVGTGPVLQEPGAEEGTSA